MKKDFLKRLFIIAGVFLGVIAWGGYASASEKLSVAAAEERPALDPQQNPAYWIDQGGLFLTYGNEQAAIRAYKKAIELDPGNSGAYFNMGVAHGEIGEYESALASINKAIAMNPARGLYYYGRARVYLLAGQKAEALSDFEKAAAAGDSEAQKYLKRIAR